jgi:hypothetical protein
MTDTVHTYYFPFTATVTLKGKNDCGFEFATRSIEVLQAPWVTFTVSSESVNIGDTVTFTSTVYDVDHLLWDFGDGVTSTLSNPTHIYTAPLTATVVLTGFSECGFATAQEVVGVDYGQTFVYLPLALKETGGFHAFRGEDWMLVALPITAGIMLLGKRRRQ